MPTSEQKMGALWRKETRDHQEYLSGEVVVDGQKHRLVVFRNGYKANDRQPDFIIYRDERSASSPAERGDADE
ncbi:MAG: hypothetical protein AB7Q29_14915 [Vicinamibacterales bacterium]